MCTVCGQSTDTYLDNKIIYIKYAKRKIRKIRCCIISHKKSIIYCRNFCHCHSGLRMQVVFSEVGGGGGVWQPPQCLQCAQCVWQRSRAHCTDFIPKNDRKTKIILCDICTVLRNVIKMMPWSPIPERYLMDGSWYNGYMVMKVKGVRYSGKAKPGFSESCHLPHPGNILTFQQLRCTPQLTTSVSSRSPTLASVLRGWWKQSWHSADETLNWIWFVIGVSLYIWHYLKGATP